MLNRKLAINLMWGLTGLSVMLYLTAATLGNLRENGFAFQAIHGALFFIYLAAVWVVIRSRPAGKILVGAIILGAIVFRVIMSFTAPTLSNDIYRYAWDGKIQAAGISPYEYIPNDPALSPLRGNSEYAMLKDNIRAAAVYQPAAQLLFLSSAPFGDHAVQALKLILALLDIAAILILRKLLLALRRPPELVILYAWCPLTVFEIAGSGHVDGLIVFLLVAAVYLAVTEKRFLAGLAIGAAASTKLYPLALLPAVMRDKWDWRTAGGAAVGMAALYAPYMWLGGEIIPIVGGASGGPSFNPGLKSLLILINGSQSPGVDNAYIIVAAVALTGLSIFVWTKRKDANGMVRACFLITAAIIVLLPYTVPWYLVMVLPFAAAELSGAFIWLSGTIMMSYLFYAMAPWSLPVWLPAVEFVPFFALLLFEFKAGLRDKSLPLYRLIYR